MPGDVLPRPNTPAAPGRSPPTALSEAEWTRAWWRIFDTRVGIIPLPIYLVLLGLITGFVLMDWVPSDILMSIVLLAVGGFTCAEIGKRLPVLRNVGAAAIIATFIPSALTYYHLLPAPILASVTEFTKVSNFLYLFIAAIIVGSILGMDRKVLIAAFIKIFVPLAVGTVAAGLVGTSVGALLGLGAWHTFFVMAPIMAGGVGEGAIPLSVGYALILHEPQGDLFAQVLPPVMLGSLTAILLAGTLNSVGKRYPRLTGERRLQPSEAVDVEHAGANPEAESHGAAVPDVQTVSAAVVTAVTLYLVGVLAKRLFDFPAPVTMLFLAVAARLGRLVSPGLEAGAHRV